MYKIKLTESEVNTIYNITTNLKKQERLMSILSYIKKYSDESGVLTRSLNTLYKMYIRLPHRKVTRSYFYSMVANLRDYNLIQDKLKDKIQDKTEVVQTVDMSSVEGNIEKHNNSNNNIHTHTIDTVEIVDELLVDLKIRSKVIKNMVLEKIRNVNLQPQGAIQYILKVILEKVEIYNKMKNMYAIKVADNRRKSNSINHGKKQGQFCNYANQRKSYQDIEDLLLNY